MTDKPHTSGDGGEVVSLRRPRPCPICRNPSRPRWHPFCSKRCADIDLHRWLSGRYVIPGSADESADAGAGARAAGDDDGGRED